MRSKNYSFNEFLKILSVLFFFLDGSFCNSIDNKFTAEIFSGATDCFYQSIHVGSQLKASFQVLSGGNYDISFSIHDPFSYRMVHDDRLTSKTHILIAPVSGDYKFCFDNSFSQFYSKIVYFDLSAENENDESKDQIFKNPMLHSSLEQKISGVEEQLEKIHNLLKKTRGIQGLFSAIESRSRSVAESNFERINFWSALQLTVMFLSALLYIFLIRKLFATDYNPTKSKMKT